MNVAYGCYLRPCMLIPVVVLNPKSSTTRRAEISARLDHLGTQYSAFDAIDGRALSASERENLAPSSALLFDRSLTATEIGCAASHFAAIRQLAAENHEFVCVLEDDAVPLTPDLRFFLEPQTLRAIPRFDVLRMVSDSARWKRPAWKVAEIHRRGIYAMARPGWGLQGQVYSRSGLHKMDFSAWCDIGTGRFCFVPRLSHQRLAGAGSASRPPRTR